MRSQELVDIIKRLPEGEGSIGDQQVSVKQRELATIGSRGGERYPKTTHAFDIQITKAKQRGGTSISCTPFTISPASDSRNDGSLKIVINGEEVATASEFTFSGWSALEGSITSDELAGIIDLLKKVKSKVKQKETEETKTRREPSPRRRMMNTVLTKGGGGH